MKLFTVRFMSAIALSPLLQGCVSSQSMQFGAVAVGELPIRPTILREGVSGEDCPNGAGSYGSYAAATERAIGSVPGATALINARFSRTERPVAKICVRVVGDAVRL
jgi:hypothetical protein